MPHFRIRLVVSIICGITITAFLLTYQKGPSLRTLAKKHNLAIGTAVSSWQLKDKEFTSTLLHEFNLITPENEMKFEVLNPYPGQYDFSGADQIVSYAQRHHLQVRGHTLVWTSQLPAWLESGGYSRDELIVILHAHIQTVLTRYRGKIVYWDVVNEGLANDGTIATNNFWQEHIGPDYIALAFRWAHEVDPNAELFYNESYVEGKSPKFDGLVALLKQLITQGVPIDGVGFEMHTGLGWSPNPEELAENMRTLNDLGLQVHITEMDVRIEDPVTADELNQQAIVYAEILQTCLDALNCTAFSTWGLSDAHSWIPDVYPGMSSPLLFTSAYQPKPAYHAMIDVLEGKE